MSAGIARSLVSCAAAWLGLWSFIIIGIAVFGEPDDGVMTPSAWVGKAALAILAAWAGAGAVSILAIGTRWRVVAVSFVAFQALLSGVGLFEGAIEQFWSGGRVLSEWPMHLGVFVVCVAFLIVLASKATWIAFDNIEE